MSSVGIFLIADSSKIWPFFLIALISISSKYLLRLNGKHIFNPNNFGILYVAYLFPSDVMIGPHRWGGDILWSLIIILIGFFIVFKVKRVYLVLSYLISFLFLSSIRSAMLGINFLTSVSAFLGPGSQLFIFFMITDPKTTPDNKFKQICFGFILATIDNYFRLIQNKNAPLLALAFTCLLMNFVLSYLEKNTYSRHQYKLTV